MGSAKKLDNAKKSDLQQRRKAPLITPTDLGAAASKSIEGGMNGILADVFALYLKTKNFHWHMSGPHFRDYHLLLDEQADQIYAMTDPIAERIRKVGGTTLRSIGHIARLQRIKDNDAEYVDAQDMLAELREDNQSLTARMREVHEVVDELNDIATASLLENWIDETERRAWFLFEASRTNLTVPFSVLDLSPIVAGGTAADALRNSLDLARRVEDLGFTRFWLAEHHNMTGIASAATVVVIAHVAAGTRRIRVGSGGIMLPNHAPLVVAEQFGTLATLYPDRIDLGLGRAPGTDLLTARALRRDLATSAEQFPQDVMELQAYFEPMAPGQSVRAIPGEGTRVPLWILGSSLFGASLAAALGLPFAFASHFAPDALMPALQIYRSRFKPSRQLQRPHAMVAANIVAADTDAQARYLFTSLQQAFLRLRRGEPGPLPAPVSAIETIAGEPELAGLRQALECSFVGSVATVTQGVRAFLERTGADELIVSGHIHDHQARLRSFELAAQVRDAL